MSFWQLFYSVGSFIAYWINYACSKHTKALGEWSWKMVVIFQMLVPIIIICQLPFLPETPRWYIQHGDRVEDARASLRRVRDNEQDVEDEILAIREAITFEKEVISGSYWALFKDPSLRKRLGLAFVINVGQQLTGQGTLNSYSSTIYKKVWSSVDTINLINALNATCGILLHPQRCVDRRSLWSKVLVHRRRHRYGIVHDDCCNRRVENARHVYQVGTGWHRHRLPTLPLHLLLQAILGSHDLDLDLRGFLHERSNAGRRHVLADAERGTGHFQPVLPYILRQLRTVSSPPSHPLSPPRN